MRPDTDTLKAWYREMTLVRRFEERARQAYQQGKIGGFLHLYIGEEAIATGAIHALRPQDHIVTHYRDHGHAIARGLDPKEWQDGTEPGLSATIHFRERDADIGLIAGRCSACGQVHLPQPRVCYRCHAKDRFEPYRLSDKRGRLLSYTFDYFFPAAEPPTSMVMTEVEGCRLYVQLADATPDQVRLELPVEYVFRKIHDAGGKPNYFWKASPVREESE